MYRRAFQLFNLVCVIVLLLLPLSCCSQNEVCEDQNIICQNTNNCCLIKTHEIRIDVRSPNNILVNETFNIRNNSTTSIESIHLWLNQSFTDLNVQDNMGNLAYQLIGGTKLLSINFRNVIEINQTHTIKLSYRLNREIPFYPNGESYYSFQFMTSVTYFTEYQRIIVRLPKNTFIHEEEGIDSYFPHTDPPFDTGYRLALIWIFQDLEPCENQLLLILFDEPIGPSPVWLYVIGPIVTLALGIAGTVWVMKLREKRVMKKIGDIFLSEIQKSFLGIIAENGGKMSQKELTTITGFTKTKVSRNLIALEQQKLITREKWGRNYRIFITETGEQVIK